MSAEIHSLLANASLFQVNGQPTNPWLVGIDFELTVSQFHPASVELRLDLPILIFEMKQYGVSLTRDNARQFVVDDIKNQSEDALDVYLTMVRYILTPPPHRKSFGWFARVFSVPPKWTPPPVQWKWANIAEITLVNEDALAIYGNCYPVSTP